MISSHHSNWILCFWWRPGFKLVSPPHPLNFFLLTVSQLPSYHWQRWGASVCIHIQLSVSTVTVQIFFQLWATDIFDKFKNTPILCTLIYHPPKFNMDFIQDFTDFMVGLTLNHYRFLIVCDFNIHVCCYSGPLVKGFLNLVDSFNLIKLVSWHMKRDTHWTLCYPSI